MIRDTSAQDRPIASRTERRKMILWIVVGAAVLLALVVVSPTIMRLLSADSSASFARLRIAQVTRGTLVRDVSVQGKVVAAVSPTLYARSAGTLTLAVHAGDQVKKGEVLAEIDSPELTSKLKQEQATLDSMTLDIERTAIDNHKQQAATQMAYEQAVIDRQTAEREVERNQKAFDRGAQPEMAVLRARDALAKARLSETNAQRTIALDRERLAFDLKTKRFVRDRQKLLVDDLTRQIDELKLRSPVDGQVGQLIAQQRASVAADAPILTVVDLSALEIQVQIPEVFAHDLSPGMSAEIRDGAQTYAGEVGAISPQVVDGQVTGRVRLGDKKPAGLRQNQQLTTRILIDEHPDVLMVERGQFVDSGAGRVAYVVHGDTAERTPIQLGATSLNAVEIVSGLKEGDRIVISGTDEFKSAQHIALSN
jgi:HlyD family secretion protein